MLAEAETHAVNVTDPDPQEGILSASELAALLTTKTEEAVNLAGRDQSEDLPAPAAELPPATDEAEAEIDIPEEEAVRLEVVTGTDITTSRKPDKEALELVPCGYAIAALALPMRVEGETLHCLVAEPIDRAAIERVGKVSGKLIVPEKAAIQEVVEGLRLAYQTEEQPGARKELVKAADLQPHFLARMRNMFKKWA
jgi:hypothetical protein